MRTALLGAGVVLAGCGHEQAAVTRCDHDCVGCDPSCNPAPEAEWSGPVLLWSGPEAEAPACPEVAPRVIYEGHDGLMAEQMCPECTCGPPSCMLPQGVIFSSEPDCVNYDVPGATVTHYMAPPEWTGECFSPAMVPGEDAKVIIYLPSRVSRCDPITGSSAMSTVATWTTMARACELQEPATLVDSTVAPFSRCVYQEGESAACPAGYPERRVFYSGMTSTVSCSPCTCGLPEGSACWTWMTEHHHEPCSSKFQSARWVGLEGACDLWLGGPGIDINGISAKLHTNQPNEPGQTHPGTCKPSGGEPMGEAVPDGATIFCCESEAEPE